MTDIIKTLRNKYNSRERVIIADALADIIKAWREDPDSFGDNEKDYRNTLAEVAETFAPWKFIEDETVE